jgi:hypothetical protein
MLPWYSNKSIPFNTADNWVVALTALLLSPRAVNSATSFKTTASEYLQLGIFPFISGHYSYLVNIYEIKNQNCIHEENSSRLNSRNVCCY